MKIINIQAVRLNIPRPEPKTKPRRESWGATAEVANPMSRFPKVKRHRSLWTPAWESVWCQVTLEDGTWGLGSTSHGRPVAAVIDDHLAPNLIGEDIFGIEKIADMMFRLTKPYGSVGLASYAVSAVDLALWDALGKLQDKPVYQLLGGPHKERMFCYATGNDIDWYIELGFRAFKLACPYGPADGMDGLRRNEELVAQTRERIGDTCELMLDCWMAFDVEYTVRLADTLRPYGLRWMEECLIPEDLDAHVALRQRLPWQTLSTGEHWYTHVPFQWAANHHVVDILQPDINWVGGVSTCRKIAQIADAAGISVMLHGGGGNAFGQHFSCAMPAVPWLEYFVGSPPGVPLEELPRIPGEPIPQDGWLTPSDGPGFGLDVPAKWIEPFFGS
jgi:L-rhamnonate dehydratase